VRPEGAGGRQLAAVQIRDVALLAGVSVATVSNVLNRPELVSPTMQERVLNAVAELGYVRNESARALRVGRSRTVGMLVPELGNPFFTDVAEGAETLADQFEATLLLCGSAGSLARQRRHLERLHALRVQGVLITPIELPDDQLLYVAKQGTPLVMLGRQSVSDGFCSVCTDDLQGGFLAGKHVVELGHRRLAFVGGDRFTKRLRGAKDAMGQAGLDPQMVEIATRGSQRSEDGRRAGDAIADLSARQRPTAIICGNDLIALGVLQAMTSRGVRVPADVAIVGYDDISYAANAAVPITSIRQPRADLGRAAAGLLFDEIHNRAGHQHSQVKFQPEIVVRASSGGHVPAEAGHPKGKNRRPRARN
jgi:LacI family transcriptional regulator